VCGIFSVTFGFCCYLGVLSAPVAIALGAYQLVQIKNNPAGFGGKPFALTGVITGSIYFVLVAVIIIIYGGLIFLGQMAK